MNLKQFTEIVDKTTQIMSREQLQCLLHSIARKVPEEKRNVFLEAFEDVQNITETSSEGKCSKVEVRKVDEKEIRKELSILKKLFHQMEEEELTFQATGYEDYSMGYGGDNWKWEYEDSEEVCQIYEDACRMLQRCVNDGFYKEAVELFDSMMEVEVMVENDWENFSMGLEELQEETLISVNLENLALYILYASYQATAPEKRAQELYDYFSISCFKNVKVENMLSLGREELEGLPKFWDSWIELLIEKNGHLEGRLLEDAVIYHRGESGMLEVARLASKNHPSLYQRVLESLAHSHENARQLEVGKEALEKVEKKYVLRSEIALKTAEAAIQLGDEDCTHDCWLEAFISSTTPVNYLRLVVESGNWDNYRLRAKDIIGTAKTYDCAGYRSLGVLAVNNVFDNEMNILRFLSGDFEFVMKLCRKKKEALGWSSTFIKCGISLILLLLLKEEDLKQGGTSMAENLRNYMKFDAKTYFKGTKYAQEYGKSQAVRPNELEIFWQCFKHWKSEIDVADEQAEQYLCDLEKMIDKRIRAIVSNQHRAYYDSVAELAAALGEVKESRGEKSAKAAILQKYRDAFPRHSSFQSALRANGMQNRR